MRPLLLLALLTASWQCAQPSPLPPEFLFGASTYPELQTREEWNRMLDTFQKAHINTVRVSESSWGNLETAPGKYNFGWLKDYLDDVQRHGMKAILGTSSYIAPQWLSAKNPDMLVRDRPGVPVHPMGRKAACLTHPLYRKAVRSYVLALGRAFKDHPAVIGWQLDNEIEFMVDRPCYNDSCERAWRAWLKTTYHTPAEFNRRWNLVSWGMEVDSLDDVPQVTAAVEGAAPGRVALPALKLANLHFRRDVILDFFAEQTQTLREAGVKQWITTDWNTIWTGIADDPQARRSLDLASLNFYQPSAENPEFWSTLAWHLDMHRSAHGLGRFLVTETRVGVAGDAVMWDAFPTRDQFRMWMMQPAAFGAMGLLYWSGNRWHGGHWPHWGGILDWTGTPEPDFPWLVEMGEWYAKWSDRLLRNPVHATAAILTDFDQRAALTAYGHTPASRQILPQAFDAFHRLGIGVDAVNLDTAAQPGALAKYALVVIPAASALDGAALPPALEAYVAAGGHVIVSPLTAYHSWDGVFRKDGFASNLAGLTGASARTARRMGDGQQVAWLDTLSPVGIDGFVEYLNVQPGAEIIGRFRSPEPLLDGQPAAVRRRTGKGTAVKLAFWPADDALLHLIRTLVPIDGNPLAAPLSPGLQAVPRTDGSLFVINTTPRPAEVRLIGQPSLALKPYEVHWLQK